MMVINKFPLQNDDDIATLMQRHFAEGRPELIKAGNWKLIRGAVIKWRMHQAAETPLHRELFRWLDVAKRNNIIR